jgi:hypothetical protein
MRVRKLAIQYLTDAGYTVEATAGSSTKSRWPQASAQESILRIIPESWFP